MIKLLVGLLALGSVSVYAAQCEIVTDIYQNNNYKSWKTIKKVEKFAKEKNMIVSSHYLSWEHEKLPALDYDYAISTVTDERKTKRAVKKSIAYVITNRNGESIYKSNVINFSYPKGVTKQYFAYENVLFRGYKKAIRFISKEENCN